MSTLARMAVLLAVLFACSTAPTRRDSMPDANPEAWSMTGKIAVSDGKEGGSGRIEWRQDGERFRIEIRAPVSRQTWRLTGGPDGATLEGLEGGPRSGPDAETLLRDAVGWSVPVADMVAWARGARGQGGADIEYDDAGRPAWLKQRGWTVEYRAWLDGTPPLPGKIFAANGDRRVRLVVERWHDGADGG